MNASELLRCMGGIVLREILRFVYQRERFVAALVRPMLWLLIFAAGFRAILGVSIVEPYETYIPYEVYIVPGLIGMILLFNGMQSSLSMVYDREMGSMRVLLVSPMPRPYLLFCRLLAGTSISVVQAYAFLALAAALGVRMPGWGYVALLPVLLVSGMMLGAIGMLLSSIIQQLENFAGIMNFVIFPMFFLSSALYPLWRIQESSDLLYWLCLLNPFTYAVELIRFAQYLKFDGSAFGIVVGAFFGFLACAIYAYDPARGIMSRRDAVAG